MRVLIFTFEVIYQRFRKVFNHFKGAIWALQIGYNTDEVTYIVALSMSRRREGERFYHKQKYYKWRHNTYTPLAGYLTIYIKKAKVKID